MMPPSRTRSLLGLHISGPAFRLAGSGRRDDPFGDLAVIIDRRDPNAEIGVDDMRRVHDVMVRRGADRHDLVIAVPAPMLVHRILQVPSAAWRSDPDGSVQVELAEHHADLVKQMESASWAIPAGPRRSETIDVMTVACAHGNADILLDLAEEGGLSVRALDCEGAAILRALPRSAHVPGTLSAALLLDWEYCLFTAYLDEMLVFERMDTERGLAALFSDLGAGEDLGLEIIRSIFFDDLLNESEQTVGQLPGEIAATVRQYLDGVLDELGVSLSYLNHRHPDNDVGSLHLLGPGASIPNVESLVADRTGIEALHVLDPCPAARREDDSRRTPELAVAVGLARYRGDAS